METNIMPRKSMYLYYPFIALGMSFLLYLHLRVSSFSFYSHGFHPSLWFLLITGGLFWAALVFLQMLSAQGAARKRDISLSQIRKRDDLVLLPLLLFLFSPLLLYHYTTVQDFQVRLNIFTVVILSGVLLLKWLELRRFGMRSPLRVLVKALNAMPKKKRLAAMFAAALIVYFLAAGILVFHKGRAFSGDEPYYLMTTDSLYEDGDINVADEYAERDYFNFYPREIYPKLRLRPYARFGKEGTHTIYPISQPGVSALILPQYWLSRFFQGRTRIFIIKSSLCLWGALLGLQLYLLGLELWKNRRAAFLVWLFYSFTAPVLFFSFHIYPAVPIALFSVYIFRTARSDKKPGTFRLLFSGFLLSLFFWFGLKYNMIFYPLLFVCLYLFLKKHKLGWKTAFFVIFPAAAIPLFYFYIHSLYGTINPIALYRGVLSPKILKDFQSVVLHTPLHLRVSSFFNYFLDQRDGLLLYSPFYFFALLGLIEAFRRSRKDLIMLLLISAPFIFNYAFFAHRQGHSPQARVLMPLSWAGAVLAGYFLIYNRKKLFRWLFRIAGGISLLTAVLLLHNPSALYQPTTHQFTFRGGELFLSLSNLYFYLPDYLPSFLKIKNWSWLPNYFWIAAMVVFMAAYAAKKNFRFPVRFSAVSAGVLFAAAAVSLWLSFFPTYVLLSPVRADFGGGFRTGIYGINRDAKMKNPGEIRLSRSPYTYRFFVTSWRPIPSLHFSLGTKEGHYRIKVMYFDELLFEGETRYETKEIQADLRKSYPYKNTNLYRITVKLEHLGGKTPPESPFRFNFHPERSPDTRSFPP